MSVTRRRFLIGSGIVSTALIVRPPSTPAPPEEVLEAEIIEDLDVVTPRPMTRLEMFLKSRGIKPAHLARESGYSRQHLLVSAWAAWSRRGGASRASSSPVAG